MIDPVSIASLTKAASSLYGMADRVLSSGNGDTALVIEFCDRVRRINEEAAERLHASDVISLGRKAAELRQWGAIGIEALGEKIPIESKTGLTAAIKRVAALLDDPGLAQASAEIRHLTAMELAKSAGTIGGLGDVLRFKAGKATPAYATSAKSVGSWFACTGGYLTGSVATAVVATGLSKVPIVGGTLASLVQGEKLESDDERNA